MTALSINLNKIALIRNSRDTDYPSVTRHAHMCVAAGANGITVHPRPDQRHIRVDDCFELAAALAPLAVEFNIEGNPFAPPMKSTRNGVSDYPGFLEIVHTIAPDQCTLVPDANAQLTSDHGFNLKHDGERLAPIIAQLRSAGIRVSLFMDPDEQQIALASAIGADRIEFYTGPYAHAYTDELTRSETLQLFSTAAQQAQALGLGVNAGHDLNLENLPDFTEALPGLLEVSIGHAFTVDCIELGLPQAVAAYQRALGNR